jgi:hypothetical protein
VVALLDDPLRTTVLEALRDRLKALEHLDPGAIQVMGERATIHLDSRFRVELHKQNGVWRVADFN